MLHFSKHACMYCIICHMMIYKSKRNGPGSHNILPCRFCLSLAGAFVKQSRADISTSILKSTYDAPVIRERRFNVC